MYIYFIPNLFVLAFFLKCNWDSLAQQLRVNTTFPENLSFLYNSHAGWHTKAHNSSFRDP